MTLNDTYCTINIEIFCTVNGTHHQVNVTHQICSFLFVLMVPPILLLLSSSCFYMRLKEKHHLKDVGNNHKYHGMCSYCLQQIMRAQIHTKSSLDRNWLLVTGHMCVLVMFIKTSPRLLYSLRRIWYLSHIHTYISSHIYSYIGHPYLTVPLYV